MKKLRKGQVVYIQGTYKGKVVEDHGYYVNVKPLEGITCKHNHSYFTYGKPLLSLKRKKK